MVIAAGPLSAGPLSAGPIVARLTGAGLTGAGPIGRDAAQRLARQELSKEVYHPRISFVTWLNQQLDRIFNTASSAVPGGWWTIVALVAVAVIVIALVLARVGPVARARRTSPGPLHGFQPMTAREHRDLAERLAADADHSGAILEYVRAIATGLDERAILPSGPGRTADELATEAGRLLPAYADALTAAARLFDDIRYGGRVGTAEGTDRLRDLEAAISIATPARPEAAEARPAIPAGTR
jgi:hypothetical protein